MGRFSTAPSLVAAALMAAMAAPAGAEMSTSIRGFGTLGFVVTDEDDAVYIIGNQSDGADDEGSFENDTRVGVQFDTEINDRFSSTVQVLGLYNEEGSFEPGVEWAFLRAQLNDTFAARAGRIGLPVFNVSDFRLVGFANTALRPPQDVYSQVPFRSFDGVDLTANFALGDAFLSTQVLFGNTEIDFPGDAVFSGEELVGVNASVEYGPARFRLGYTATDLSADSPGLTQLGMGLAATAQAAPPLAPALEPLIDAFDLDGDSASFTSVGLDLDFDPFVLNIEYTQRRIDAFIPDTTGWLVLGAYRLGAFTPYAYVSELSEDDSLDASALSGAAAASGDPALLGLSAAVDSQVRSVAQSSTAFGLRWDFAPGFALKGQYELIDQEAVGNSFEGKDVTYTGGDDVSVYSIGVDFVF